MRDKFEVYGTVQNVKGRSGRPAVQRMMKVLRQCYRPTHNFQGSLQGSVVVRPEAWNWNGMCRCSISNNTERLEICFTSLSTMSCC